MKKQRKYLLTIKRNNNDYVSVEWNLTSFYNGEDLTTLEGIDTFTRKMTRVELLNDLLKKNMVDGNDEIMDFAIIYYENGKNRELKEGTIFLDDDNVWYDDLFLFYIVENLNNKSIVSYLYNMCDIKSDSKKLKEFKYVLKNIELFKNKGKNGVIGALSLFKEIEYDIKRKILLRLSDRIAIKPFIESKNLVLSENIDGKAV